MKNVCLIIFLFFSSLVTALSEEIYLRCIPEITQVRAGDFKKGQILAHRILYAKFAEEYDLTKSEKPTKVLKELKTYLTNYKGKKDKFSFENLEYRETDKTKSFNFEDLYETKKFRSFFTMNINYDGGSWVSSGNLDISELKKGKLNKSNFSWYGDCFSLTKKQFKKPLGNEDFYNSVK